MSNDLMNELLNLRLDVIINHPKGNVVYASVLKNYTGKQATVKNMYAILFGNESIVDGENDNVVDNKINDIKFI